MRVCPDHGRHFGADCPECLNPTMVASTRSQGTQPHDFSPAPHNDWRFNDEPWCLVCGSSQTACEARQRIISMSDPAIHGYVCPTCQYSRARFDEACRYCLFTNFNAKDTPMTTTIPYTITNESITVLLDGMPTTVHKGTPQYTALRTALLTENYGDVSQLLTSTGVLARYLQGTAFTARDGALFYNTFEVPDDIRRRLEELVMEGKDPTPILRFYERVEKNPSYRSRTQLFAFLQHVGVPIEPDGTFLAYKGVRSDYKDCHSGTFDNRPGAVHQMPRNQISDDPDEACAVGFHVGALSYAANFGPIVVICRVDPADVVSVPADEQFRKMRVCRYIVMGRWSGEAMPSTTTDISDDVGADDEGLPEEGDDLPEILLGVPAASYSDEERARIGEAIDGLKADEPKPRRKPAAKGKLGKMQSMKPAELMDCTIDELRTLAKAMKIVGATKIPGGKSALIAAISKYRRRKS